MPPKSKKAKQESIFQQPGGAAAPGGGGEEDDDMEVHEAGIGLEYNSGEEWDLEEDDDMEGEAGVESSSSNGGKEPANKVNRGKDAAPSKKEDDRTVQVDFEFCDFRPSHFHSVKNLLGGFTPNAETISPAQLSDTVIEQVFVGTTLTVTEQSDEAYGFVTALNFHHQLKSPCFKALKS